VKHTTTNGGSVQMQPH